MRCRPGAVRRLGVTRVTSEPVAPLTSAQCRVSAAVSGSGVPWTEPSSRQERRECRAVALAVIGAAVTHQKITDGRLHGESYTAAAQLRGFGKSACSNHGKRPTVRWRRCARNRNGVDFGLLSVHRPRQVWGGLRLNWQFIDRD